MKGRAHPSHSGCAHSTPRCQNGPVNSILMPINWDLLAGCTSALLLPNVAVTEVRITKHTYYVSFIYRIMYIVHHHILGYEPSAQLMAHAIKKMTTLDSSNSTNTTLLHQI